MAEAAALDGGRERARMGAPLRTADEKMILLKTYFKSKNYIHHQIDSFNYFIDHTIPSIVNANSTITCEEDPKFWLKFSNVRVLEACNSEDMVRTSTTPQECRYRDMTYSAPIYVDATYIKAGRVATANRIHIGNIPVMLKSKICVLTGKRPAELARMNECPMDPGGYFVIRGQERAILMQENLKMNRIMIGQDDKNNYTTSCSSGTYTSYKTRCTIVMKEQRIVLKHGSLSDEVPVIVVLKALGVESAQEVVQLVGTESKFSDALSGSIEQAAELNIHSQFQAKIYIARKLRSGIGLPKKSRMALTDDFLEQLLLSHITLNKENGEPNYRPKVVFLCTMIRRVILASRGELPVDDKDYFGNKKIDMAGDMLALLFEDLFKRFNSTMSRIASTGLAKTQRTSSFDIINSIRTDIITNGFVTALATGVWNLPRFKMSKVGVTEVVSRLSYIATVGVLTRVISSVDKTRKTAGPRSLHGSQFGIICPSDTPEGHSIGLVKNLTLTASVTSEENPQPLMSLLLDLGVEDINICNVCDIYKEKPRSSPDEEREYTMITPYLVFVNGTILGITRNRKIVDTIRMLRRSGRIHEYISVNVNEQHKCIYVSCDGGRCCRPLIIIDKQGYSKLLDKDKTYINNMKKGYISLEDMLQDGVIEYLDVNEENDALIAFTEEEIIPGKTTHLEMNPLTFLGICASLIPYPHHNQSPRNTYQCVHKDGEILVLREGQIKNIHANDVVIGDLIVSVDPDTAKWEPPNEKDFVAKSYHRHLITKVTAHKKDIEAENDIIKLSILTGKQFITTDDHLFFTSDGWKEATLIRKGDYIGISPLEYIVDSKEPITEEMLLPMVYETYIKHMHETNNDSNIMTFKVFKENVFLYSGVLFVPVTAFEHILHDEIPTISDLVNSFIDITVGPIDDIPDISTSEEKVPTTPSTFIYNGAIVHNCAMGKQAMGPQGYMQFKRTDNLLLVQVYNQYFLCGGRRVAQGPMAKKYSKFAEEQINNNNNNNKKAGKGTNDKNKESSNDKSQLIQNNIISQPPSNINYLTNKEPGVVNVKLAEDEEMLVDIVDDAANIYKKSKPRIELPTVTSPTAPPLPCGFNATVCVCSYSSYDIEDAIVIGAHAAQRGLGAIWAIRREAVVECGNVNGYMRIQKDEKMGYAGISGCRQQNISAANSPVNAMTTIATTFNNPTHASIINMNGANIYNTVYEGLRNKKALEQAALSTKTISLKTQPIQQSEQQAQNLETGNQDNQLNITISKSQSGDINNGDKNENKKAEEKREAKKEEEEEESEEMLISRVPKNEKVQTQTQANEQINDPNDPNDQTKKTIDENKQQAEQEKKEQETSSILHQLLDSDGLPRVGSSVFDEDPIACKLVIVKNNIKQGMTNDKKPGDQIVSSYKAHPYVYRKQIPTTIHSVTVTSSLRSPILAKIVTRQWRYPELGDKYSSRHGQKGTVGLIVRDCDFPMTHSGHIPDLIMNPHGFPSRMTVGKMLEMVCGKAGVLNGHYGDGSAFGGDKIDAIGAELVSRGYNYGGKEVLYSGITGMPLNVYVFFGPIFYQRLKHMVVDKMHARSKGPTTILTRQPTEGRAKDGGLRLGEMERDCLVSYGAAGLVLERLMTSSDEFLVSVCEKCGLICMPKWCQKCRSGANVVRMRIPYACKLMFQELMSMGVVPRVILKEAGTGAAR